MDIVIDWINGLAGLLGGLGVLFAGIAALWSRIKPKKVIKQTRRNGVWGLLPGIILLAISAGIFTTRAITAQEQPLNVQLTKQAWDAFNEEDYERAIVHAEECINEFRGAADREQKQLEEDHVPLPPKGKVSDQQKEIILARGLLNDVATCFWIKGRSAENLERIEEAKQAYQATLRYTYARCWDPKGWFWAPSEAASDRLSQLQ